MAEFEPFSVQLRVYWEDTDGGGVVFYANYLKFMERARTEWLRSLGLVQAEMQSERNIVFAVVSLQIDYLSPAQMDDELLVTAAPMQAGRSSIRFAQEIVRVTDGKPICRGEVRVACVRADTFRPTRIP